MGGNQHRYTVQCILSEGDEGVKRAEDILYMFSYALGPIMSALIVWSLGLLLSQIFSAVYTAYTARTCQNKATRHFHLNRLVTIDVRMLACILFLISEQSSLRIHMLRRHWPLCSARVITQIISIKVIVSFVGSQTGSLNPGTLSS